MKDIDRLDLALSKIGVAKAQIQVRVDAILERDVNVSDAITGPGVGIGYLLAKRLADALATAEAEITLLRERDAGWRTIDTAPKDGTLVLLLIAFDDDREHHIDDEAAPSRTIGFNNLDHDGEDVWKFSGWCWTHDCFTEGEGNPIAWRPFPPVGQATRACGPIAPSETETKGCTAQ